MQCSVRIFLMTVTMAGLTQVASATTYQIDSAHASAAFKVKHLAISNVPGKFTGIAGIVDIDATDLSKSKVDATIDPKTINTDNAKRDEHLRSPDFFDVAKYPTIEFKSKAVKGTNPNDFTIDGDLTLHGVTKPVGLHVTNLTAEIKDPFGGVRRGVSATTKVNRKDFGLTWNKTLETGGLLIGDDVELVIDAELIKK